MKRMFSILMTAAVLLVLVAGMTTAAFAAEVVDFVDVYDVALEAGQPLPTTASTDGYGTVTSITWEKWNFTTHTWEAATGNVEDGNAYRMTARVTAVTGYSFASACQVYINGEWMNTWAYGDGSTYVDVMHAFPVGLELVHDISFASEPEVVDGGDPAAAVPTVDAESPYVIMNYAWVEYDMVNSSTGSLTGNFQKGKAYQLEMDLAPKAGYWFDRYVYISTAQPYVDGVNEDDATLWVNTEYYLTTPIEKVELTVTGIGEGKDIADVKISIPDGANYVIDSWELSEDNNDVSAGTFGKHLYNLRVWFDPAAGYHFAEDVIVTVNGEAAQNYYGYGNTCNAGMEYDYRTVIDKVEFTVTGVETGKDSADMKVSIPDGANYTLNDWGVTDSDRDSVTGAFGKDGYWVHAYVEPNAGYRFSEDTVVTINGEAPKNKDLGSNYCYAEKLYEFRTPIDKVELTVTGVETGKTAADVKITFPEGANYKLDHTYIFDRNWNEVTGTFGKAFYTVDVYLVPLDGYYFLENAEIVVTGGKLDYESVEDSWMNVEVDFDFTEKITHLELPAWPQIKAGDAVPAMTPVDPDGKPYMYALAYLDFEEEELAEGTFANDKTYAAMYQAMADEGYSFADDLVITIGGQTYNGWVQNYGNGVITIQMYALGNAKLYSRFDVTVDRPAAGAQPGRVYVSDSAAYKLEDFDWGVADNKDGNNIGVPGEVFKVGDHVYLGLEFSVEDGLIDPNATIYINGTAYETIGEFTEFSGRSMHTAVYLGEMKEAFNANTGDNTPVETLVALALASVLGLGLLIGRRKEI